MSPYCLRIVSVLSPYCLHIVFAELMPEQKEERRGTRTNRGHQSKADRAGARSRLAVRFVSPRSPQCLLHQRRRFRGRVGVGLRRPFFGSRGGTRRLGATRLATCVQAMTSGGYKSPVRASIGRGRSEGVNAGARGRHGERGVGRTGATESMDSRIQNPKPKAKKRSKSKGSLFIAPTPKFERS